MATKRPAGNPATIQIIKDALATWAVNYRTEVTKPLRELWILEFGAMDPELINAVLQRVLRTKKGFFPDVADAWAVIRESQAIVHRSMADQAWKQVNEFLDFWGSDFSERLFSWKPSEVVAIAEKLPNGLYLCKPRVFDAATNYAVARLGGYHAAGMRTLKDEHFHEKNFTEAFVRFQETDGLQVLGRTEAREIYSKLQNALKERDGHSLTEGNR